MKESVSVTTAKYCPYCGRPSLSSSMGTSVCLSCGASFLTARLSETSTSHERASLTQDRPLLDHYRVPTFRPAVSEEPPNAHLSQIDKAAKALNLPDNIRKAARTIYRRAFATERKSVEGLAPASVYAACKQGGLPKSLDQIATAFGVDKNEAERSYTYLLNEMGYLSSTLFSGETVVMTPKIAQQGPDHDLDVAKFLEKKGTYEFFRLLKEKPRRWKTLETELALSPRTLSERISQALELGFIEKVRRLKIGATCYRLTKKGNDVFEAMTGSTRIY